VSQKNVPPLACYNFDTHEWILMFFGRNFTNKVDNHKTLCYATSSLVHPVDRFDSEGWFSSDQVIFLTVFRVFW